MQALIAVPVLVAAWAGCAGPSKVLSVDPTANGTIVARAQCPVISEAAQLAPALESYYREDLEKAGLIAQLAAHPLTSIFTEAERLSLIRAARTGHCERVTYLSDGLRVTGFVVRPPGEGPHPVLIWLRGGNRDFGAIEPITLFNLAAFAEAGFVVVATQYRGVDGGQGHDEFGGAELDDVLALVPLARSVPGADTSRLYVYGGSRGAMEGSMALRHGLAARAAVFRGGLFDLPRALTYRPDLRAGWAEMMPDLEKDPDGALARRSAIQWAGELRVPVLMVHGRQDWRVKLEDVQAFDAVIGAAGLEHHLVIYDDDEHQLVFHRREWIAEAVAWFTAHGAFAR